MSITIALSDDLLYWITCLQNHDPPAILSASSYVVQTGRLRHLTYTNDMSATGLLILGSGLLTIVIITGLLLTWPHTPPRERREQLGRPLLVGGIIGLAFLPLQFALQRELKTSDQRVANRQRRDEARQTLLLQLTLRTHLKGIDLSSENLRRLYLPSKDLRAARLDHADLRQATLTNTDLRYSSARHAKFDHATLSHVDFRRAVIAESSFKHADMTHVDFSRRSPLDLTDGPSRSHFDYSYLVDADFHFSRIESDSTFIGASFVDADLTYSSFRDVDLRRAVFMSTHAPAAAFCNANLRGAIIGEGSMRAAQFTAADLRNARFYAGTDFTDANFSGADLRGSRIITAIDAPTSDTSFMPYDSAPFTTARHLFRGAYFDRDTKGASFLRRRGAHLAPPSLDCYQQLGKYSGGGEASPLNNP